MSINLKIFEKLNELDIKLDKLKLENDNEIYTPDRACNYLGISKSYLYKLTSKNEIGFFKPNKKMIYFTKAQLRDYVLKSK